MITEVRLDFETASACELKTAGAWRYAEDPTTEVVARTLFNGLRANLKAQAKGKGARYPLRRGVRLVRVRVWETAHGWAEFEG